MATGSSVFLYPEYVGRLVVTKGSNVNVRQSNSTSSAIVMTVAKTGTIIGKSGTRKWNGINGDKYMWYELADDAGFIREDLAEILPEDAQKELQFDLDSVQIRDMETFNSLNKCVAMMEKLPAPKSSLEQYAVDLSKAKGKMSDLLASVHQRQLKMQMEAQKNGSGLKIDKTICANEASTWSSLYEWNKKNGSNVLFGFPEKRRTNNQDLGFVITTGIFVLILVATVIAAAAITYIATVKPFKNGANIDHKMAKDLEKELEKLGGTELVSKVQTEIKKASVDSYELGHRQADAEKSFLPNIGKYAILAGVGVSAVLFGPKAYKFIKQKIKEKSKK